MKIRPSYDRIVVKRIEEQETARGGIIIPDSDQEKPQEAEVIAIGRRQARRIRQPACPRCQSRRHRILFGRYSGNEIRLDGEEYLTMREGDVLGVLDTVSKTAKQAGSQDM